MKRRKTGRDGFQGWSPASAAAWERIFGEGPQEPAKPPFEVEMGAGAEGPYIIARGDLLKEVWGSEGD